MDERRTITRIGLICALIFTACFLAAWPIAEMGFNDDWSYIKSAQVFAQTGHLVYSGWAMAMLGWQVLWGALFVRLFGLSFTAVKLSTFPLAIGILLLFHAVQVRFGISSRNAIVGTLTLGLSPLFMPLAASFMSDVPGLFVIVLCLYCCQRAVTAGTDRAAIAWLCFAAASNVVGGTARQIAWLGALVMVPCTGWLLRKRRGVLLSAMVCWGAAFAFVFYCMHWFARQPYSVPVGLLNGAPTAVRHPILATVLAMLGEFLCLLLLVFPVLIAWLPRIRKVRGPALLGVACALLFLTWLQWATRWNPPWLGNLLHPEFSSARAANVSFSIGPFILGKPVYSLLSLPVIAAFLAFLATAAHPSGATSGAPGRPLPESRSSGF